MTPTRRAAVALAVLAVAAPFVASWLVLPVAVAIVSATVVDALLVRSSPALRREAPSVVVRGQPASLKLELATPVRGHVRLRQPVGPDLRLTPGEADEALDAELVGRRRGAHPLPAPAVRVRGPLGLGAWTHRAGDDGEVRVYPDVRQIRQYDMLARQNRTAQVGLRRVRQGVSRRHSLLGGPLRRHVRRRAGEL